MRGCRARLVWLLVLSLAWLGPALGGEEEDGEVVAEEDDTLSDELGEEDGVLVLHEHNFARALSEHRLLLVEFCKCPPDVGRGAGRGMGRGICGDGCGQGIWAGGTGQGHGYGQKQARGQGHRQGHGCRMGHRVGWEWGRGMGYRQG